MGHLPRSLLATTAALAAGAALAFGAAGSSVTSVGACRTAQPSAKFISEARKALVGYLGRNRPGVMLAGAGHRVSNGVTAEGSYNWSGYVDTSSTAQFFTSVSGSWTTPSVSCTAEDQVTSDWVGLDGRHSDPRSSRTARSAGASRAHRSTSPGTRCIRPAPSRSERPCSLVTNQARR